MADTYQQGELFEIGSDYRPLPSVWEGEDAPLLELMLHFYPKSQPHMILDATINEGRFWRGTTRNIIGLDIEIGFKPTVNGSNLEMPFADESFDVVIYDPPHIPNQGQDKEKDFNTRFGLVQKSPKENGYNFSHLYPVFSKEAYRVLRPQGILLVKIADYVHNHRMQWAHFELMKSAAEAGFCPCDMIVKIRKGPIVDPRWKVAHHARRQHVFWIVFRKSLKCE
jgi:hypothetical protein